MTIKLPISGLHAFVRRGAKEGSLLYPHKHRDGCFVVSKTRFEKDYIRVPDEADLMDWLERGFSLRMSNADAGVTQPSLIEPRKIYRPVRA